MTFAPEPICIIGRDVISTPVTLGTRFSPKPALTDVGEDEGGVGDGRTDAVVRLV